MLLRATIQLRFLLVLLGVLFSLESWSQQLQASAEVAGSPAPLSYAEQMPAFPGGEAALHSYLAKQTKYPAAALQHGLSGQVVVQFTVDEQGRVLDPTVVKTTDEAFNPEALRLTWLMPWWTPGREHGQPVRVRCTLPIKFTFKR